MESKELLKSKKGQFNITGLLTPVFAWIVGVIAFVIIVIIGTALFPLWNTTVSDLGAAGIPVVSSIAAAADGGLFNVLYGVGILIGAVAAAAVVIIAGSKIGGRGGKK